jgi:uncharacterized protein YutE (UPF0331/DUF86 family)
MDRIYKIYEENGMARVWAEIDVDTITKSLKNRDEAIEEWLKVVEFLLATDPTFVERKRSL